MGEKILIETAKSVKDLDGVYTKVKNGSKGYGFTAVAALKDDVVKNAMTESKKSADFIVEVDFVGNSIIAQLVCDVKGKMRSVIGRREIKSKEEWEKAVSLAKNQALSRSAAEFLLKL